MLRYLAHGSKDLAGGPIVVTTRFNWEFYANLDGLLRPLLPGQTKLPYSKPTLWVFAPNKPHGWEADKAVDRVVFHFSSVPEVIEMQCAERGYASTELRTEDLPVLRELALSLEDHYRTPTPASLLLFERARIDLSLYFLREQKFNVSLPLESVAVERVERAMEWYLSHLESRPTLEALADVVHVSPAHLRRQFKLVYGKSPHAVLTQLRLEKAAQLLATTNQKLEVISRQSGFNSASDLCRVFHRQFNVYPNVWRTYVSGTEQNQRDAQLARLIAKSGNQAQHAAASKLETSEAVKKG